MRAVVQDRYGPVETLDVRDVVRPAPGESEALVRVHGAGVDRGVCHLTTGLPYLVRLAGYGLRAPRTPVPGMDLAGVVEAVGRDVKRFVPGDEVFGIGRGSFAEHACAPESTLAPRPVNLGLRQAAAVGVSGTAALQAVRDHARVQPGQRVLVMGASGGVGTFAVQVAKSQGAEVTGACSPEKVDLVRARGAGPVGG
jgi:NADPH:quinone reductase-like Zn-dependent oxidoreductase